MVPTKLTGSLRISQRLSTAASAPANAAVIATLAFRAWARKRSHDAFDQRWPATRVLPALPGDVLRDALAEVRLRMPAELLSGPLPRDLGAAAEVSGAARRVLDLDVADQRDARFWAIS